MKCFYLSLLVLVLSTKGLKSQDPMSNAWAKCAAATASNVNPIDPLSVCSAALDDLFKCLKRDLPSSSNPVDQAMYRNINLNNLNKAKTYLCSKGDIMNKANLTCMSNFGTCLSNIDQMMSGCLDLIPCFYKVVNTCSPSGAIIFSKTLTILKSNPCTLTNYHYKLSPFYGPEMECYPKIPKPSGTAAAKLGVAYEYFCKNFEKQTVSDCIEHNLIKKKSVLNLDDDYINDSKTFFRERSELCEYFSRPSIKTCSHIDVLSCQNELLETDAYSKSFDELQGNYASCVYDKYKSCDVPLANAIRHNLVSGHKSEAAAVNLSSLVLLVANLAVIMYTL